MKCPCCGANLLYEKDITYCEYCGYEERIAVIRPEYNLIIQHTYGIENVKVVEIRIRDSNILYNLPVNSTIGYRLLPGPHKITFRVGKYSWTKVVVLSNDDKVVTVDFAYMPSTMTGARFNIDQPDPGPEYAEILKNGNMPPEASVLANIALVMSITFFMSTPAFIMAIIDMSISRSKGQPVSTRAKAALIISIVTCFFWMMITASARRL